MSPIIFSFSFRQEVPKKHADSNKLEIDNQVNNLLRQGKDTLTWSLFIIADIGSKIIQIQFNSCLFTCCLNSVMAH
jgi:hypothetical protein